jgi:hypothetical protein
MSRWHARTGRSTLRKAFLFPAAIRFARPFELGDQCPTARFPDHAIHETRATPSAVRSRDTAEPAAIFGSSCPWSAPIGRCFPTHSDHTGGRFQAHCGAVEDWFRGMQLHVPMGGRGPRRLEVARAGNSIDARCRDSVEWPTVERGTPPLLRYVTSRAPVESPETATTGPHERLAPATFQPRPLSP